jgi:menaquinol-cytochrome c reductase iron-sulfur subunit
MLKKSDYLISRRGFVGAVVALVSAIVCVVLGLPAIGYVISPSLKKGGQDEWVTLGPVSAMKPGVPTPFTFSVMREVAWRRARITRSVYAVTQDGEDITVFSDACTHLSCKVHWEAERNAFICPCHDGVFDKTGNVVSGPPPEPLHRFKTRIDNDQVMIYVAA